MRKVTTIEVVVKHATTAGELLTALAAVSTHARVSVRSVPGDRNEDPTTSIVLTQTEDV